LEQRNAFRKPNFSPKTALLPPSQMKMGVQRSYAATLNMPAQLAASPPAFSLPKRLWVNFCTTFAAGIAAFECTDRLLIGRSFISGVQEFTLKPTEE